MLTVKVREAPPFCIEGRRCPIRESDRLPTESPRSECQGKEGVCSPFLQAKGFYEYWQRLSPSRQSPACPDALPPAGLPGSQQSQRRAFRGQGCYGLEGK